MCTTTPSGSVAVVSSVPVLIFQVRGYLSEGLGHEICELVEKELLRGKKTIILDFSPCTVMTSLGVASIFNLAVRVTEDFKARMALAALKPIMVKILELSEVDRLVEITDTVEEAVSSLSFG